MFHPNYKHTMFERNTGAGDFTNLAQNLHAILVFLASILLS